MKNLLSAILLVLLIGALWLAMYIAAMVIGTGLAIIALYTMFKEYNPS